jgi:hypothetical protein
MTLNKKLTALVAYLRDQMVNLQANLTPAQLEMRGTAEDWSAKANLIHALVWADRRLVILETLERGEVWTEIDYGDFEEENRRIWEKYQGTSWDEVQEMVLSTYDGILDYLGRIDEAVLLQAAPGEERLIWRSIADNYALHPMIHLWDLLQKAGKPAYLKEIFGEGFADLLRSIDDSSQWLGTISYNQACLYALSGEVQEAIIALKNALDMTPQLSDWSRQDSDLDSLRGLPEYLALYPED